MGYEIRHEGIVSQVFFECLVDIGYHRSVAINQLLQCLFSELQLAGAVAEEVEFEFLEVRLDD